MFLTKEDLNLTTYPEILDAISREDDLFVESHLKAAITQVDKYLNKHYDTTALWEQTGSNRDSFMLKICVDVCVYNIYSVLPEAPIIRRERYDYAISELKDIRRGDLILELPPKIQKEDSQENPITFGNTYNHRY